MRDGLIPNRISRDGILFNSADASMWYLHALRMYVESTRDWSLIAELFPAISQVIEAYRGGTGFQRSGAYFQIRMDTDGLVISPPQSTWMDADPSSEGTEAVTPRNGKAVEINALWYANLCWVARAAESLQSSKHKADAYRKLAGEVKQSFNERFWNEDRNCLYDVVDGDPHGSAVRPNQVIAISHGGDLLSKARQASVFDVVTNELLTPGGLRTLSPHDAMYRGKYNTFAPMSEKDLAYHQGTVWPWLIGPYGDALMKLTSNAQRLKTVITPLVRFALESKFHSIPEVFSGDPPHEPGGTRSQACSVGEVLRLVVEQNLMDS